MDKDIFVMGDLYKAGVGEEGNDIHGEIFSVVIELEDGSRIRHVTGFRSIRVEKDTDPESPYQMHFVSVRDEAMAAAEKMAARVRDHLKAGGHVDMELWQVIDPRYGSDAYDSLDKMGYFKWRETREG